MIHLTRRLKGGIALDSAAVSPALTGGVGARRRRLVVWLLVGLGIRLALLPLTVHPDLLAVYFRVDLWREGVLGTQDFHLQALPMLVHRMFAALFSMPLPDLTGLPWPGTSEEIYAKAESVLSQPRALALVMLWKLPYVLVDIACAFVAMRLVPRNWSASMFRLWMLHPILLYVVVVFGKHEPFMLLPFLIGLLELKRGHENRGFLWLGVAVAMRVYPVFVVLPMVLAISASPRRRLECLGFLCAPFFLVLSWSALGSLRHFLGLCLALAALAWLYRGLRGRYRDLVLGAGVAAVALLLARPIFRVVDGDAGGVSPMEWHGARLLDGRVALFGQDAILLFLLVFGLVCIWAHEITQGRGSHTPRQHVFDDVLDVSLMAGLVLFSLCSLNPQYFVLLAALALLRMHRGPQMAMAHALQVLGLLLYLSSFPGGAVSSWLFAPLAPAAVLALPGPMELLPERLAWVEWAALGRVLLLLGSGWMAWKVLLTRRSRERDSIATPAVSATLVATSLCWPAALLLCLVAPAWQAIPVRGAFEESAVSLNLQKPIDGYILGRTPGIPLELQIRRQGQASQTEKVPTGHRISVESQGTDAEPVRVLELPDRALIPGSDGIVKIPLGGLRLEADQVYSFTWLGHEEVSSPGMEARVTYELDGSEVVADIGREAKQRFRESALGIPWLVVLASVFLGAAGLSRKRSGRHASPD